MTHEHTQEHGIKSGANTQHTGQRARGGYTNARTRGGRHASPPSYPPGSARAWSGCRPTKARVTQVVHTKESVRACMVKSPKHASHTGSVVARVYPGMLRAKPLPQVAQAKGFSPGLYSGWVRGRASSLARRAQCIGRTSRG